MAGQYCSFVVYGDGTVKACGKVHIIIHIIIHMCIIIMHTCIYNIYVCIYVYVQYVHMCMYVCVCMSELLQSVYCIAPVFIHSDSCNNNMLATCMYVHCICMSPSIQKV